MRPSATGRSAGATGGDDVERGAMGRARPAERDGRGGVGRRRDATFHGGYVQLAAVLKGRPRSYSLKPGSGYDVAYAVFGGLEIADEDRIGRGGAGGWEVAARWSFLDLDTAGLGGGRQHNATVGLNWHPEKNLRVMLNYVRAFGDDLRGEGGRRARADADIVQVRLQIAY
jgi:phosphate-selective porin OprO/OprP